MDKRTEKRKIGDIGENVACRFLMKRGFEIIERNYLKKWGEIDIIARRYVGGAKKEEKLHFVEVKSVSHLPVSYLPGEALAKSGETDYYKPEDNLHPWKLKRLSRVIQTYLLGYQDRKGACPVKLQRSGETDWQFDVMVVYLDMKNKQAKVNYMEDIIL